jgi:hypothetical protein
MRRWLALLALLHITHIVASDPGQSQRSPLFANLFSHNASPLVRRQNDNCQNNGVSCSSLGDDADGICCPEDTICARDAAGNVGCCPYNAACTGVVSGGSSQATTGSATASATGGGSGGGIVLGGSTTTFTSTGAIQTPAGSSIQLPSTGVAGGGSTVAAAGFTFTYIPTSYANAQLCETAYSYCQSQSSACAASLGGVNGVTVGGMAGGITVSAQATSVTNAASVCSSLSSQACYGIQEDTCNSLNGGSTQTGNVVQPGVGGPRQTACPGLVYAAGMGAFYGAWRGFG